jgi:hypothetical protein
MPIHLDRWKARYEHIEADAVQIKRYLVTESTQILEASDWQIRFRKDPNNIDYDETSVQNMVDIVSILADDPIRGVIVSNVFLGRLEEAIELRR